MTSRPMSKAYSVEQLAMSRRSALLLGLAWTLASTTAEARDPRVQLKVWKDPLCGCCNEWIKHLEANGFMVSAVNESNKAVRASFGMPPRFASCHTGVVDGYVIEGHVPASDIKRMLKERPKALGLAVPGMPVGSPGMDGPDFDGQRDPYQVLLVQIDGSSQVFSSYS